MTGIRLIQTSTGGVLVKYAGVPGDVAVDVGGGSVEEDLQATLEVLVLLARVDRVSEQLLEVLEGELVHRVHVGHVGHDEVERRAAHGHDAVSLAGDRDHLLGRLGLLQTLRDHRRRHLYAPQPRAARNIRPRSIWF